MIRSEAENVRFFCMVGDRDSLFWSQHSRQNSLAVCQVSSSQRSPEAGDDTPRVPLRFMRRKLGDGRPDLQVGEMNAPSEKGAGSRPAVELTGSGSDGRWGDKGKFWNGRRRVGKAVQELRFGHPKARTLQDENSWIHGRLNPH